MTLRTRRRIFYALVALFILVGGAVVFYAQGWRIDFGTWHFAKVGGIYVRAYPEGAAIYLNGEPVQNHSGFLSPGTLLSDLLPRTYSVTLKAAGYDNWQENASVRPSLVVPFQYAVLVPQNGVPAPTGTAFKIPQPTGAYANGTSSAINPHDANEKIVARQNKISIFDIAQATTTESVAIQGKNLEAKWITGNIAGILQANGELYLYDTNADAATKLADDVKDFAAASDGSMVAALERKSLEIFPIAGENNYYRFNLPNIANAERAIWYKDQTHLFIVYPNQVSFLDLADTSLINFTTVAQGVNPIYDPQSNALYITSPAKAVLQYSFPN